VQADGVLSTISQVMKWFQTRDENYTSVVVPGMRLDMRNTNNDRASCPTTKSAGVEGVR